MAKSESLLRPVAYEKPGAIPKQMKKPGLSLRLNPGNIWITYYTSFKGNGLFIHQNRVKI